MRELAKWDTQTEQMHLGKVRQGCRKPSICGGEKKAVSSKHNKAKHNKIIIINYR